MPRRSPELMDLLERAMRKYGVTWDLRLTTERIDITSFGDAMRSYASGMVDCDVRLRCNPQQLEEMLRALDGAQIVERRVDVMAPTFGDVACTYCGSNVTPGDACESCGSRKASKVEVLTRAPRKMNVV